MTGRARPGLARAARFAAYALLALAALALAAALVIPAVIDTQAVETELQARLSQMVHGKIAWERLEIRLLPRPRGALSKVRAEIPKTASVRAEEVEVRLRLLPLLRGHAEIASVNLTKPSVELEIASTPPSRDGPGDPVEGYRSVIEAIQRLAPEAVLDVEDADLDVRVGGLPRIRLRNLDVVAKTGTKGVQVELTAESEYWTGLRLTAQVAFSDFSGTASLRVTEARPQVWLDHFLEASPVSIALPVASLRAQARTDGKAALECEFDLGAPSASVARAGERLPIPDFALSGKVAAGAREITAQLKNAQLGASRLAAGSLRYSLEDGTFSGHTEFDLDLAQSVDGTRRLLAREAGKALALFQPVAGRAKGRARANAGRAGWSVAIDIRESDSSIGIEGIPAPVKIAGALVEVGRDAVKIDRAALAMLDAQANASATIAYARQLGIDGAVSESSLGEGFLAWIWKTAGLPPQLELKAPVRIAVQRAAWTPKGPVEVEATARFDSGSSVAFDLGWTPDTIDVRRATIKDARSDATIALRARANQIDGRFSGSLYSSSLAAALKSAKLPSGGASGELRLSLDRRHPERFSAEGRLKGEAIDLEWLLGQPVRIDSLDLQAGGGSLRIGSAGVNWAGQSFSVRGDVRRGAAGPIVDAQLDSPGIILDKILPASDKSSAAKSEAVDEGAKDDTSSLWPLPVTGRVALRSDFVQSGRYKVAPFAAVLALEERSARVDFQKVQLCGISLPAKLEATPEGIVMEARIAAHKQQLETTAHCLTERGVMMSGTFDLNADLRARGRLRDLTRNLEGTIRAESRDGKVMKFALLGNILSMQNIAAMLKEGTPRIGDEGFPYRSLSASGRFKAGRFTLDEGVFQSPGVGLAATGWISLTDYQSRLSVLVAPFGRLDRMVRGVPVVGYVIGGAITSIPVGVSGDIRDPLVVPLGPAAITSELVGILERTVKLPGKLVPRGEAPADSPPPQ